MTEKKENEHDIVFKRLIDERKRVDIDELLHRRLIFLKLTDVIDYNIDENNIVKIVPLDSSDWVKASINQFLHLKATDLELSVPFDEYISEALETTQNKQ